MPVSAATSEADGPDDEVEGAPLVASREAAAGAVPVRTRFPAGVVERDHRSSSATWSSRSRRVTRPLRPSPAEVSVVTGGGGTSE